MKNEHMLREATVTASPRQPGWDSMSGAHTRSRCQHRTQKGGTNTKYVCDTFSKAIILLSEEKKKQDTKLRLQPVIDYINKIHGESWEIGTKRLTVEQGTSSFSCIFPVF